MTLAQAYENLTSKKFLKPLDLTPMPNPVPPTWNLNEYCHFHKKLGHKTDNCFRFKHEIQELIDNGTLPNLNIITKPNIRKNPLPDYHRAAPLYQNYVLVEEVDWDCSKLIEVVDVNMVQIQGKWDEEDENLKSATTMWGILPKGMSELKKMILKDDVVNITRSRKHYNQRITTEGMWRKDQSLIPNRFYMLSGAMLLSVRSGM